MNLIKQFLIREPDQIVEANRNEPIGILNLQLKLGSTRAAGAARLRRRARAPGRRRLESLRCNLLGLRTRHECLAAVADYCSRRRRSALGARRRLDHVGLPRRAADRGRPGHGTGGRPAFLPNRDHHSAWVNTAALTPRGHRREYPRPARRADRAGRTPGVPPARCTTGPCGWSRSTSRRPVRPS